MCVSSTHCIYVGSFLCILVGELQPNHMDVLYYWPISYVIEFNWET